MVALRSFAALCLSLALALGVATPARAEASGLELVYSNLTALRVNPLGVQNAFELSLRHGLYDPGDSEVLANNYVGLIVAPTLTPGHARLGVALDVRPLNILKVEARLEYLNWFGNFDLTQSYPDVGADFSDTAIEAAGDAGLNYATDGWQFTLDAEVRAKLGPVIIRSRAKLAYVDMALRGGDRVYYDQYYDLLEPGTGWFLLNDADVLLSLGEHWIVGLRDSIATAFYPDSAYPGTTRSTTSVPTHRLGPLIAYRFSDEPGAAFNQPTVLLIVNWYLSHRYRTGADVSQAIPYVVLGFAFNGSLL